MQRLLSSPPLPSLNANDDWHLSVQASFASGEISRNYDAWSDKMGDGFKGSPQAYAGGLGFTTRSKGSFSHFVFGIHSQGKADIINSDPMPMWSIHDSQVSASAFGAGINYVLLGAVEDPFTLGIFGGGMYLLNETKYIFTRPATSTTAETSSNISTKATNYGPMLGTQFKIRIGWLSFIPYYMYYWDVGDRCMNYEENGVSKNCPMSVDNTFSVVGLMLGISHFRFTVYSKTETKIDTSDTNMQAYQVSYTFDF